jgi:hypothetical protein
MKAELKRIETEALRLSVEERELLIGALVDSLDRERPDQAVTGDFGGFATADLQTYWLDEAERRLQRIRSGEMQTRPAAEVMAEVRARLKTSGEVR